MAKNKKSKSLLNEATVRRMMKLADIPELSDNFLAEEAYEWHKGGDSKTRPGEKDDDDSAGDKGARGDTDYSGHGDRADDDSSTHPGRKDYEEVNEEDELDAVEGELGHEDDVADEEGAELDAEASGGDAEITPEAAQAIVDLAAQLEASGALEGGEEEVEAEAEVEMSDVGGEEEVEIEGEEEIEELEEALAKLGIEVIDDKKLNEAVRKRVIARLRKEKRVKAQEAKVNQIADRIFARLQKK
jgi:hypothetical protein